MLSEPRLVEVPERLDGWDRAVRGDRGPGPGARQAEAQALRVAATARVQGRCRWGRQWVFDAGLAWFAGRSAAN
ncbi:MAG: hypothetical protein R3F65_20230 [bacterium]